MTDTKSFKVDMGEDAHVLLMTICKFLRWKDKDLHITEAMFIDEAVRLAEVFEITLDITRLKLIYQQMY